MGAADMFRPSPTLTEHRAALARLIALESAPPGAGDPDAVKLTGDQTVTGVKTFTLAPVVPDGAFPVAKLSGLSTIALGASQITSGVLATARLGTGTASSGKYLDGTGAWITLPAGGAPSYATALAGTTLTLDRVGASWPARPTSRTDIVVRWRGVAPAPALITSGTAGMYAVDEFVEEVAP